MLARVKGGNFLGAVHPKPSVVFGCLGLQGETVEARKGFCDLILQESSSAAVGLWRSPTRKTHAGQNLKLHPCWISIVLPTSSPSGDQVLQLFQQLYCISSPKMEEISKSNLKVSCWLQAVLGLLLKCGCTWANLP